LSQNHPINSMSVLGVEFGTVIDAMVILYELLRERFSY
jgi:hypothetical protein